ncbi:MAG: c-type cytochrome domain-containing protein [Ardenticatenia bacterium]|nr:c-type cytochrome domain-containing protein [Ardenticatenia bacterium]
MSSRTLLVLGALLVLLVVAGSTMTTVLATPTAPVTLSGRAKPRDATPLKSDRLIIQLSGVEAPSLGDLRGYLIQDDGQIVTPIGTLSVTSDTIDTSWDSPTQENLIGTYSTFRITREEVYAEAALPAGALNHIRHVVYQRSETPNNVGYAVGLVQQAETLLTHATNAKTWADQHDLDEAKRHTEHVINILVGEDSPFFQDWNGDGDLQNPGDGFGILPGSEDRNGDGRINVGYAKGTHDHIQNAANSADATDNIKARADQVKAATYNIMGREGDPTYPNWGNQLLTTAQALINATTITETQQYADEMVRLADLILNGTDANGNGKVEPVADEGGAQTAHLYAQHAADYYPEGHGVTGRIKQRDATLLGSDRLVFALSGLDAPLPGTSYTLYLYNDDETVTQVITGLVPVNGELTGTWDSPTQENLIGTYSTLKLVREVAYAEDTLPAGALNHIRHVVYQRSETPNNVGYAVGLVQQAETLLTHATNAKTWADQHDLDEAKRHTEHVINILVGEDSPFFQDWNGDGDLQNPGDGFGILPGSEDRNGDGRINVGYAKGTHDHIQNAANSADATDNIKARADQVKAATYNIMGREGDPTYPNWGNQLLTTAQALINATTITETQQYADEMVRLADLILNGTDANGNGKVEPVADEGGAQTAYLYAQHAADYYPQRVLAFAIFLPLITSSPPQVSYANDIQPIFDAYCVTCHGDLGPEDGLSLTSYEKVMAGSVAGPVIIPGDSDNSELVKRIKGISQPRMPFGGPPLNDEHIRVVEMWVAQGAQNN